MFSHTQMVTGRLFGEGSSLQKKNIFKMYSCVGLMYLSFVGLPLY